MGNPTTNFGWQMPTATDLVTDLPADFEVFGQAVDTDFVDLLGGTTGQILSKATGTDLDFAWITNDVGDITAVTAGTGISGGGTSGAVTITNSMATAIDAKGDLIVGTAADTFTRLAAGTNGQVLTADSAEATGLKWDTVGGGGKVLQVVQATYSTATTIASTTYTDTGLSLSITPSDATSKILVIANIAGQAEGFSSAVNVGLGVRLLRGATTVFTQDPIRQSTLLYAQPVSGSNGLIDRKVTAISYLDSPATTSATTYKIQGASETATGTNQAVFQASSSVSTITLLEIGA
jgi:hypothetical protein